MDKKGIVVYCASSQDIHPQYFKEARELGAGIAALGLPLIDGGGAVGLMGAVNDGALEAGGKAIGVIPRFMHERGWGHKGLSQLEVVESMHQRKALMASMACIAVALPGGIGTFEELMEIITWKKLHLFDGHVIICNTRGYYDPLLKMLRRSVDEGFYNRDLLDDILLASSAAETLTLCRQILDTH